MFNLKQEVYMFKNFLIVFLFATFCITGCKTRPIVNVEGFIPEGLTKVQIKNAIADGCEKVDWAWDTVNEDNVRASKLVKEHYQIVVDIDFSRTTKYEIKYLQSDNLKDEGKGEIHKAYYKWVGKLKKNIDRSLKNMSQRVRYCGKDSDNGLKSMCVYND